MNETRPMLENVITFTGPAKEDLMNRLNEVGPIRLNLGCGNDYLEGWCNIDYGQAVKCDLSINLDDHMLRMPWDDNKVDVIAAFHILEHIQHIQKLKNEMARILKPNGVLSIMVPNYTSMDAWGDDTHCRAFSIHSFMRQYWPNMHPEMVEIVPVKDALGNKNEWLYAQIRGGK